MTLYEARYFVPYFEKFRQLRHCVAYDGPDAVDEAITELLDRRERDGTVYSEDYSSFDQSINPKWSEFELKSISENFQDDDFGIAIDYFVNGGLVTPDGIYTGPHGIPSGSMFTSIVGSSCHLRAQWEVRGELHPWEGQVMGDDGVVVHPKSITKKEIADVYSSLGLVYNEDKTFESDKEVVYLQRYYSTDYRVNGIIRGIYPVYRALNRLLHMERWTQIDTSAISGSDYFAIRAVAILENCKWHPLHESIVKWVAKQDKYGLTYTNQGLAEYVRNYQTKSKTGLRHQYSDNLDGIGAFKTMQVLRNMH
jgi:hypothetical protein